MSNAQILANSINEWVTPIIEKGFENIAGQNQITFLLSNLITPERIAQAIKQHLSIPFIEQQLAKLPDEVIPGFSLEIIDGMIQTRVERGALEIPMIGVRLNPDAFRNLKHICETNFKMYAEKSEPKAVTEKAKREDKEVTE